MSAKTCQLCGKPLGRMRVGTGDFCSREHRNQFRLRRSMDHLLEANKVASLMRRRENPKQIPLAQLIAASASEPRDIENGVFHPGNIRFDFQPLRPLLLDLAITASGRCLSLARRGSVTLAPRIDDPSELPFPVKPSSRPALPSRGMPRTSACLPRASLVNIPCQAPGTDVAPRESEAALRVKRQAVSEFRQLRIEAPGSASIARKRQPRLATPPRDIPVQERASAAPGPARRNPASRASRCTARTRTELPVGRPLGYDMLSIAIFSDPRECDVPPPERTARIRPLRAPQPIQPRPAQSFLPLSPEPGAANTREAQLSEPRWKSEPRAPLYSVRPSIAGAMDFAARPPLLPAGNGPAQAQAYQLAEVPFTPQNSAFDPTPIPLHGTLTTLETEPAPLPPALEDDFNSGLDRWTGDTAGWKLDVAGARPGGLALLEPSLAWTDYDFEFLTRIGKHSVTFVVRASDANNCHRLTLGPAEGGGHELRSVVVLDGQEQTPAREPVGNKVRAASAFTVKVTMQGNEFTVSVDGEVVARGREERLPVGGIGFTSLPGDQARLYWVRLTPLAVPISEAASSRPPRSNS